MIQDKLIQWAAFLLVVLYMFLAGMGIEIKVGSMLGNKSVYFFNSEKLFSPVTSADITESLNLLRSAVWS